MALKVRQFKESDRPHLRKMMLAEGWKDESRYAFGREGTFTFIMDVDGDVQGFFTVGQVKNHPYLIHFCVGKKHRGGGNWQRFSREMYSVMQQTGRKRFFVAAEKWQDRTIRFLRRFAGGRDYSLDGETVYFYCEVNKHG